MNPKTQLELLRSLKRLKSPGKTMAQGFTLIELMIVVAIVGILSALAVPQYLNARNRAQASAGIGQIVGLSKECATGQASGLVQVVDPGGVASTGNISCDGTANRTFTTSWTGNAAGIQCLSVTAAEGNTNAAITVNSVGGMSCVISGG